MSEYHLFKRQLEIESKLLAGSAVLNWDMRLGKTRAVLHAFNKLTFQGGPMTCVVVCPSIAKGVWENENREMGLDIPTLVLDGITKKRSTGVHVQNLPLLMILNWEIVDAYLPELQRLAGYEKIVLVLDETHEHCCNPRNARYKAVRDLAMMADRTWILTGTLYRTSAMDLHHQLRLLGPSYYPHYYTKLSVFGDKFCFPRYNSFSKTWEYKGIQPGTEAELINLPVIDRRLEEMTELPEEVTWWLDEGDKWAYNGGEQAGAMALARSELSALKAERTLEFIRRNNLLEEPLVIFGWHHKFIDGVAAGLLDKKRIGIIDGNVSSAQKTAITRAFAKGEIDVIVANIESAGMSVDLASARNAVFGEIDWVKATMNQAEARIRGPKQKRRPCYWYVLAMNSVDEFVWRSMLARGRDMKRLDAAKSA
jgi:SNF2 family DNA or RNA helicase